MPRSVRPATGPISIPDTPPMWFAAMCNAVGRGDWLAAHHAAQNLVRHGFRVNYTNPLIDADDAVYVPTTPSNGVRA